MHAHDSACILFSACQHLYSAANDLANADAQKCVMLISVVSVNDGNDRTDNQVKTLSLQMSQFSAVSVYSLLNTKH